MKGERTSVGYEIGYISFFYIFVWGRIIHKVLIVCGCFDERAEFSPLGRQENIDFDGVD